MEKKIGKRAAARLAWVSGSPFGGYMLYVPDGPTYGEATRDFRALHLLAFGNYRAAQTIANAIRAHVMGAK